MSVRTLILCLATCLLCISKVAIGDALSNEQVEAELTNTYSITPSSGDDYQYRRHDYVDEVGLKPSQSIDTFYQRLLKGNHTALPSEQVTSWIPIAGDITFFIPKEKTEYPLAKRVGDAFVQSQLIRSQVFNQVGRHLLSLTFQSEAQQIDVLYDNAFSLSMASGFTKKFGDALTPEDIALGGKDILWPELRTISGEQVLVPVMYLTDRTYTDQNVSGYKVEFNEGEALFREVVINSGSVTLNRNAILSAAENFVIAEGAEVVGTDSLNLKAGGTLLNTGSISAANAIDITAANYYQKTIVHRFNTPYGFNDRLGLVSSINAGTDLTINSMTDITLLGAEAQAGNDIVFDAQGNITIGAVALQSQSLLSSRNSERSASAKDYVQSNLSAGDNIRLMAGGLIEINASTLHAERGHIELLAGLGVSILDEMGVEQSSYHGDFGNFTEDESSYVTIAMRAVLDAGKGIKIHSDKGDITLKAVDIKSVEGTNVSASDGAINMLMAVENDHYSYSSVKETLFTITNVSRGHNYETAVPNTIIGGIATEALYGVKVEYEGDPDLDFEGQVEQLSTMPGLEWMAEIKAQNPDVDWEVISAVFDEWDEENTSLSPAAMAVVTVVVGICTAGAGAGVIGAAAGSWQAAAANAVLSSMISTASVASSNALVNGASPIEVFEAGYEAVLSEQGLKSATTAMVTAGVISGLDAKFFSPSDVEIQSVLVESANSTPSQIKTAIDNINKLTFQQQIAQTLTHSVVDAGISTAINGGEFTEVLKSSLAQTGIDFLGNKMAGDIANSAANGNMPLAFEYIANAASGCITGSLTAANNQANTVNDGCASGALGSLVSQVVTDSYEASHKDEVQELFELELAEISDKVNKGASSLEVYGFVTGSSNFYRGKANRLVASGIDIAKLTAALSAFAAGVDVGTATASADRIANSALQLMSIGVMDALVQADREMAIYDSTSFTTPISQNQLDLAQILEVPLVELSDGQIYFIYENYELQKISSEEQLKELVVIFEEVLVKEKLSAERAEFAQAATAEFLQKMRDRVLDQQIMFADSTWNVVGSGDSEEFHIIWSPDQLPEDALSANAEQAFYKVFDEMSFGLATAALESMGVEVDTSAIDASQQQIYMAARAEVSSAMGISEESFDDAAKYATYLLMVKDVKDVAELRKVYKAWKGHKAGVDNVSGIADEVYPQKIDSSDVPDRNLVGQLEPGNLRSTSLPRNGDRLVLDQGRLPTCGPNSCAMVLDSSGKTFDLNRLIVDSKVTSQGAYMGDMAKALRNQGLDTARIQNSVSLDALAEATSRGNPAVVATKLDRGGHAIVVDGFTTRQGQSVVAIRDPALGRQYFTPVSEFAERFTGQAILTNAKKP